MKLRTDRGVAMTEFALVAPIIIAVLAFGTDLSLFFYRYSLMTYAASTATRMVSEELGVQVYKTGNQTCAQLATLAQTTLTAYNTSHPMIAANVSASITVSGPAFLAATGIAAPPYPMASIQYSLKNRPCVLCFFLKSLPASTSSIVIESRKSNCKTDSNTVNLP